MRAASVSQSVGTGWPRICDFYFVREHGAGSEAQKLTFRDELWRTVTDDRRWSDHQSELVALAEAAIAVSPVTHTDPLPAVDDKKDGEGQVRHLLHLKAPVFRYEYADDFPADEQLAIETARLDANRELEIEGRAGYFWRAPGRAGRMVLAGSLRCCKRRSAELEPASTGR